MNELPEDVVLENYLNQFKNKLEVFGSINLSNMK